MGLFVDCSIEMEGGMREKWGQLKDAGGERGGGG